MVFELQAGVEGQASVYFIAISGGSRISPRRGRQLSRGAPTYDFAKFPQKLHEIERIWPPRGGARPKFYYVDPPLAINIKHLARRPSRSMFCAVRTLVRKQGLSTHYNNYVNLL